MNILSQIKYIDKQEILDALTYYDHVTEYPIPDIVDDDWKTILQKPNNNSSQKTYSELIEVHNKAKSRNKEQLDLIQKIDLNANYALYKFLEQVNIKFPIDQFQELYAVIKPVLKNVKNYFNRARPYQLSQSYDLEIDVWVSNTHHSPSYPSGHTLYTRLACNIVLDQFPNLKNELDKITNITANCRIAQGVHYRSDNKASIIFTDHLYKKLKEKIYG
jgi:hypothetical protein